MTDQRCAVYDCPRPHSGHGLCKPHLKHWRAGGWLPPHNPERIDPSRQATRGSGDTVCVCREPEPYGPHGSCLVCARLVLVDGKPYHPDPDRGWEAIAAVDAMVERIDAEAARLRAVP